jgi:hypothetical protein
VIAMHELGLAREDVDQAAADGRSTLANRLTFGAGRLSQA